MELLTGLLRDFVAAILGILLILNLLDQELLGGILLVVTTGSALGIWGWKQYKQAHPS